MLKALYIYKIVRKNSIKRKMFRRTLQKVIEIKQVFVQPQNWSFFLKATENTHLLL